MTVKLVVIYPRPNESKPLKQFTTGTMCPWRSRNLPAKPRLSRPEYSVLRPANLPSTASLRFISLRWRLSNNVQLPKAANRRLGMQFRFRRAAHQSFWSRRRRRLYFEWYSPTGLLLLPLVMLGFVAGAVGQTNPNHLARERSRYLSRAMNQPVDWYPWGADPFKRAKELHRPILLDVGAVWCPWCTLMDRDTYCNVDTANYINQHFVAVKGRLRCLPEAGGAAAASPSRAKSSCRATSHIIHHARRQALLWSRVPPC